MFSPTVGPICYTEEMFLYILFIDCICVLIKDVYKYLNMFVKYVCKYVCFAI